jgi:hypothetical protein
MVFTNGPILNDINNAQSKARMAMPIKDLTSDGAASFEMNRKLFVKSYINPTTNPNTPGNAKIERNALGLNSQQAVIIGPAVALQKKWIGGNRDASQTAMRRRVQQSGRVMANVNNQPVSFVSDNDNNVTRHALARVRGGGAANVPTARATISISNKVFPATF